MRLAFVFFSLLKISQGGYVYEAGGIPKMMAAAASGMAPMSGGSARAGPTIPLASVMVSQGGGELGINVEFVPESQAFVSSNLPYPTSPVDNWESETKKRGVEKNCAYCERENSGLCVNAPSCVYCEKTVTANCNKFIPCLRCTVIKNPFFKCTPGEKYMDECDTCRCTDGHSGWCTDMFCEFRALHLLAMKMSDPELYSL